MPTNLKFCHLSRLLHEGLRDIYSSDSILMHNGAPCHSSLSTQLCLEKKKICYICDWLPQSPDLNIIENIWSLLKRNVVKRFPGTIEEFWKVAKKEWHQIEDAYIRNLYASISRRLDAVIKIKGSNSKY